jgi:hypothetical protein
MRRASGVARLTGLFVHAIALAKEMHWDRILNAVDPFERLPMY